MKVFLWKRLGLMCWQDIPIKGDSETAVKAVLNRAHLIPGVGATKFKKEFAAHVCVKSTVGMASGTEAVKKSRSVGSRILVFKRAYFTEKI